LIAYRRFSISDSLGNNNRKLDRNETADCVLTLRCNAGSVTNLTGTLRSLTPDLEVLQANAGFGNLSPDDTALNSATPFVLRASAKAPIEMPLWGELLLAGNSGFAETLRVPIIVGDSMNEPLGPDLYGYRAFGDEDITYPEHPTFDWIEIHNLGTRLALGDDDTRIIDLPPEFGPICYYGQRTTKLSICSNGWVAPDTSTRLDFNNIRLPDPYAPQRIIAVLWDNLDPTPYGWVGYYHDAANHRFIVEYDSVPYFPSYEKWEKFEVIFYDTTLAGPSGDNVFVMQYATANNIGSITSGIQNHERTAGLTDLWNEGYPRQSAPIMPGRAIKFVASPPTGIVEALPRSTGVPPVPLQAHPNPVSPVTTLSYELPKPAPASLGIYDISGRLVRTLACSRQSQGRHDFILSSAGLSKGVYFVKLESAGTASVLKLLIE
jgi:hypothetical protein